MFNNLSIISRHFSTSKTNLNIQRESKIIRKLLYGREKGKRIWYKSSDNPKLPTAISVSNTNRQGKNASRRVTVLNKLFMKHITDQMATGAIADEIKGYGLEVSGVAVTPGFELIKVFWLSKGTEDDKVIDEILKRHAGNIRHELSQLRLMGEVPRINFVQDKSYAKVAEVEYLLSKCDFGDDHVPAHTTIDKATRDLTGQEMINELPEMRNDVLGLQHDIIMRKIQQSLKKTKQAWKQYNEDKSVGSESGFQPNNLQQVNDAISNLSRDDEFKKFIEHRQLDEIIAQRKQFKREKRVSGNEPTTNDEDDSLNFYDGDYIEEDYDKNTKR